MPSRAPQPVALAVAFYREHQTHRRGDRVVVAPAGRKQARRVRAVEASLPLAQRAQIEEQLPACPGANLPLPSFDSAGEPDTIPRGSLSAAPLTPAAGDEQLLEESDGEAIRHPGEEIPRRDVEAVALEGGAVEKACRVAPDLAPEALEDAGDLAELPRRGVVLVNGGEEELAERERRLQHLGAHGDLRCFRAQHALLDDIGDHAADPLRRRAPEHFATASAGRAVACRIPARIASSMS